MKLFDTHTHLNAEQFDGIEDKIIKNALENHVHYMAVVGFDKPTIEKSLALSDQYSNIVSVIGLHPTESEHYNDEFEKYLVERLALPNVYMLGEIGLDYYWDTASPKAQDAAFRRQIDIAKQFDLPITIHNRDATEDVYRVLKEEGIPSKGCIMHSFGENRAWAEKFLELGCHISFSGVVTFKKTDDVREAAKIVPHDKLLIETDAPYLAPVPFRGKRNEPGYVYHVADTLATVRGATIEEIAELTTQNAFDLFRYTPRGK